MTEETHIPESSEEQEMEPKEEFSAEKDAGEEEENNMSKKDKKGKERIAELEAEVSELKDKYLRLYAEFDNYKRRTVKEKLDMMKNAAQDTLASLLPILDDFDRAKKIAEDPATTETFTDGVELVYQKLYTTLRAMGLQPMESTGEPFNPEHHEAITEVPAPTEELKGKVVDTIEKGYYLHDKIIRHAKVVTGK